MRAERFGDRFPTSLSALPSCMHRVRWHATDSNNTTRWCGETGAAMAYLDLFELFGLQALDGA
jgi:hypothetical protein